MMHWCRQRLLASWQSLFQHIKFGVFHTRGMYRLLVSVLCGSSILFSDLHALVKEVSDGGGLSRFPAVTVDSHATNDAEIIDKRSVARAFSRAATAYDSIACLQKDVGEGLLKLIDNGQHGSSAGNISILDLGSGHWLFFSENKV